MPDITCCTGGKCPKKEECYRFRAVPSERQSYFVEPPWERWHRCDFFWKVEAGDRLQPHPDGSTERKPEELSHSRNGPATGDNRVSHPPGEARATRHRHRKNWGIKQ